MKIYCKDCKHFKKGEYSFQCHFTIQRPNERTDPITGVTEKWIGRIEPPEMPPRTRFDILYKYQIPNENNDCKYYEPKWNIRFKNFFSSKEKSKISAARRWHGM